MRSSYSRTIMFLPLSPSPPSGRTRNAPEANLGLRGLQQAVALEDRADRRLLVLVGLDERESQPAHPVAEHVQGGLDGDRVRRDAHRRPHVLELGVDLGPAL